MRPATRAIQDYYRLSGKARQARYYHTTRHGYVENLLIDIGRPDGVNAANGDEMLTPERLQYEQSVNVRRPQVEKELMAAIREHGPMTLVELMAATGRTEYSVRTAIRRCDRIVTVRREVRGKKRWAIYGVVE